MSTTAYPEHEKQHAIVAESQAQGEFLDWLTNERGVHLMIRFEGTEPVECGCQDVNDGKPLPWCRKCEGSGRREEQLKRWVPLGTSILSLLAEYHKIDLDKLEAEQRDMLDVLRKVAAR